MNKYQLLLAFSILVLFTSCRTSEPFVSGGDQWNRSTELEERPLFTAEFEPSEFAGRRAAVMEQIGDSAIAVIQGAPSPRGYLPVRQNNEFYYLSGIESPHAYLILDGYNRETIIFLPDRDERREYGEGKVLSLQDSTLIKELSGIETVKPLSSIVSELRSFNANNLYYTLYTHQSPYEEQAMTRSMAYRRLSDRLEDPLDNRPARFEHLIAEIQKTAPILDIENLDPIVDEMRKIKSEAELTLIETSTRLHGEAILEAMRSTEPGVKAYELEAVAKYIYWKHNIQGDAYYPLIHIGPEAFMNHYHDSTRPARNGDMILMDYGAYYEYYSSDMARMWPANGRFNDVQRELYTFYLTFYEAVLSSIEPGLTPQQVMQNALEITDAAMEDFTFTAGHRREAANRFLSSYRRSAENQRMTLGHGVGLSVHDVGDYTGPIEPGMVFVIEPQFRIPEENIYIRLEDMIVVTEDGVKIISDFVPRDIRSIEGIMRDRGLLQRHPFKLDE
ncbi:MAG: Xaa-Pro peptidase family protein [Balneolaceae bacterium]